MESLPRISGGRSAGWRRGSQFAGELFGSVWVDLKCYVDKCCKKHLIVLRQPECSHLVTVSDYQDIANQCRVVPCLAFNSREPCKFFKLFRIRFNQYKFSFFRQNQQNILVGQQEKLTSIARTSPFEITFFNIDTF